MNAPRDVISAFSKGGALEQHLGGQTLVKYEEMTFFASSLNRGRGRFPLCTVEPFLARTINLKLKLKFS